MLGSRFHTEPAVVDWIAAVAAADCGFDTVAVAVPHGHNNYCLRFAGRHGDYYCCKNCHSAAAVGNYCCFHTADSHNRCYHRVVLRVEAAAIRFGLAEAVEEGWHHPVVVAAEANLHRLHSEVAEEGLSMVAAVRNCCLQPWVGMVPRVELLA